MSTRSADATIKSYFYQFNRTTEEILSLKKDSETVDIAGIEDIDINSIDGLRSVQCKYYASQTLTNSVIREPIILMLDHYRAIGASPIDKYALYGYFKNETTESIKPTIYLASVSSGYFTVQTHTRDIQSKIATIKTLYNNTFPGNPLEYFFADKKYDQQYAQEKKLGSVFIASACIAILIACMGLFGLAGFSARQRVKEIGIRKILGASVTNITTLLSKDFVRMVIIAILIASPIAWWVMKAWLDNFAYRTPVNWWIFVIAGIIAVGIALLTVSFQPIKAAIENPVENMRSE